MIQAYVVGYMITRGLPAPAIAVLDVPTEATAPRLARDDGLALCANPVAAISSADQIIHATYVRDGDMTWNIVDGDSFLDLTF